MAIKLICRFLGFCASSSATARWTSATLASAPFNPPISSTVGAAE
jgi:hypothetical protein